MTNYLDIYELATLLGKRPQTIRKNMKSRPWMVPPRMHIPGTQMLRWRRDEVEAWLTLMHQAGSADNALISAAFDDVLFDGSANDSERMRG